MFNDINEVTLLGRVTQDPNIRSTAGGAVVLSFSVATNRSYKKNEQWEKEVTYHNVVMFGPYAERLSTRVQKGTKIYVKGRIVNNKWTDAEGQQKSRTDINATEVILLDAYNKNGDGAPSEGGYNNGPDQEAIDDALNQDLPF